MILRYRLKSLQMEECFTTDSPDILKVKSDRQLEVQLNCGTLVLPANRVFDLDVNL